MLQMINEKGHQALEWFRATGSSINRQRDSLYYATAGSISSEAFINGDVGEGLKLFCLALAAREMLRLVAWGVADNAHVPVGPSGRERDNKSLSLNASGVAILPLEIVSIGYQAIVGHPLPGVMPTSHWDIAMVAGGGFQFYAAGRGPTGTGLGDLFGSYSEVMWNYPSKLAERPVEQRQVQRAIANDP